MLTLAIVTVAASRSPSGRPACLDALHGSWRGPGTILGRAIVMEQAWSPALGGAFTELRMRHLTTDTSARAMFEGRGLYRPAGAAHPDSLHGTWHDSRGIIFEVRGACDGATFSSHWSGSERGRTLYTLRNGELDVIDSVFLPTGVAREFGRSLLKRM
jgi:hypothetical protein